MRNSWCNHGFYSLQLELQDFKGKYWQGFLQIFALFFWKMKFLLYLKKHSPCTFLLLKNFFCVSTSENILQTLQAGTNFFSSKSFLLYQSNSNICTRSCFLQFFQRWYLPIPCWKKSIYLRHKRGVLSVQISILKKSQDVIYCWERDK